MPNRLREFRQRSGLSQEGLAARACTSVMLIRRVEKYDRVPSPMAAERLAAALGVAVSTVWPQTGAVEQMQ